MCPSTCCLSAYGRLLLDCRILFSHYWSVRVCVCVLFSFFGAAQVQDTRQLCWRRKKRKMIACKYSSSYAMRLWIPVWYTQTRTATHTCAAQGSNICTLCLWLWHSILIRIILIISSWVSVSGVSCVACLKVEIHSCRLIEIVNFFIALPIALTWIISIFHKEADTIDSPILFLVNKSQFASVEWIVIRDEREKSNANVNSDAIWLKFVTIQSATAGRKSFARQRRID